jgi:hypothetical protein
VDSLVYVTAQETSKRNKTPQDLAASTAKGRGNSLVEARTKSNKSSEGGDLTSRKGRRACMLSKTEGEGGCHGEGHK